MQKQAKQKQAVLFNVNILSQTVTLISSRVTDDTGYTQPTMQQLLAARGPEMGGYHLNPVTGWLLKPDGRVLHKPESWR